MASIKMLLHRQEILPLQRDELRRARLDRRKRGVNRTQAIHHFNRQAVRTTHGNKIHSAAHFPVRQFPSCESDRLDERFH
ncbi:MAG TPA: hypothetical protein VEA63_17055, partial [Opitutus sp.]|nr:hypothetical protein [Opitutus sp.]